MPRTPPPLPQNGHGDTDPGTGAPLRRHAYLCGFCARLGVPGFCETQDGRSRVGPREDVAAAGPALAASGGRRRAAQVPAPPGPACACSRPRRAAGRPAAPGWRRQSPAWRPQLRAGEDGTVAGTQPGLTLKGRESGKPRADTTPRMALSPEVPPRKPGVEAARGATPLPFPRGGRWIPTRGHGARRGPAGAAPSPRRAAGRGGRAVGRGLVVGPAGAPRLRVPPAAVGQHAARAARPGARPRPRAPARRPPRAAPSAP